MSVSPLLSSLPAPGVYARDWKRLVAIASESPLAYVKTRAFGGIGDAAVVVRANLLRALNSRINSRGGIALRDVSEKRLSRRRGEMVAAGRLVMSCRWCGSKIEDRGYLMDNNRFCDASCSSSYRGCF